MSYIVCMDRPMAGRAGAEWRTGRLDWTGKALEAIQIKLTGTLAEKYDVYYRVHCQTYGWMGWAKNGDPAGTTGHAKRLEAIQIVLRAKGTGAPGASSQPAYVGGAVPQ